MTEDEMDGITDSIDMNLRSAGSWLCTRKPGSS